MAAAMYNTVRELAEELNDQAMATRMPPR